MTDFSYLAGVYAAAVTPFRSGVLPRDEIAPWLGFLARRGCHGALLLGTTGEGPSFSYQEREAFFRAARQVRQEYPRFRLLAGVGTPSLEETGALCRLAFDLELDAVVVLPPYYFRKVSDEGLFEWYAHILRTHVPAGGPLLGYHIPSLTGVALSLDLLARLREAFPDRFAGIKDSSADPQQAHHLGQRFGRDLLVLNGNDSLFSLALQNGASGCITALANLLSPTLRRVWDAHQHGAEASAEALNDQKALEAARQFMDRYPPAPPLLKALLRRLYARPVWETRLPLVDITPEMEDRLAAEARRVLPAENLENLAPSAR